MSDSSAKPSLDMKRAFEEENMENLKRQSKSEFKLTTRKRKAGRSQLADSRCGKYIQFSFVAEPSEPKKPRLDISSSQETDNLNSCHTSKMGQSSSPTSNGSEPMKESQKQIFVCLWAIVYSQYEVSRRLQNDLLHLLHFDKNLPWFHTVLSCISLPLMKFMVYTTFGHVEPLRKAIKEKLETIYTFPEKITEYLKHISVIGLAEPPTLYRDANPKVHPTSELTYNNVPELRNAVRLTAIYTGSDGKYYGVTTSHLTDLTKSTRNRMYVGQTGTVIGKVVSNVFNPEKYAEACLIEIDHENIDVSSIAPKLQEPLVVLESNNVIQWLLHKNISILTSAEEAQEAVVCDVSGTLFDAESGFTLHGLVLVEGVGYSSVGGPGTSGSPAVWRTSSGSNALVGSHVGRIKLAQNDNLQDYKGVVQDLGNALPTFCRDIGGITLTILGLEDQAATTNSIVTEESNQEDVGACSLLPSGSQTEGIQIYQPEINPQPILVAPPTLVAQETENNDYNHHRPDVYVRPISPGPKDGPDIFVRDEKCLSEDERRESVREEEERPGLRADEEVDGRPPTRMKPENANEMTEDDDVVISDRLSKSAIMDN